uniref:Uncharacterized protein n=1 Tax=Oryza meridionalis TaxID=40149 RepID=A0A0E0EYC0_9ORYZ
MSRIVDYLQAFAAELLDGDFDTPARLEDAADGAATQPKPPSPSTSERLNPRVALLSSWKVKMRRLLLARCGSDSCRYRPNDSALISDDTFREHSDPDRRASRSVDVLLFDRADSERVVAAATADDRPRRSSLSQPANPKHCIAFDMVPGEDDDASPALHRRRGHRKKAN